MLVARWYLSVQILKSDDSTYGSVEWGRTFTQTFTQTPLWVNALLVRSCHFLGRGFDIESLSRMAKERNLLDGDHFIMYLNCLTVSEESWWRSKEKEEMGVEKPPEVVSEETKAVWRSLKECVDEIRKRHVGAVRWCVEQLRGRFERFRQQHNTGTQRSLISSHQPSGVSHSQTTLGELAGNVPSHESASAFSEVTTGTDERKRREPPPDEAVLNLRLFKITENLVSKVKAKEKGWDRDHLAPLCFPFGLQSFPISPQTQYQPKPLPVHFEKEGPGFLSAFVETRSRDPTDDKRGRHQHTAAISRFSSWSFEELRWHDRQLKEKEKDQQQPVLHGPGFSVPFTGPPYDFSGRDPDLYGQHQHVAAMDSLKCWSFEELRWQDMCRKRNKKEQDRVVGPLIFQPVSAAGQEKKKPPSEEPTKPVVEAALKAIRNKAGRESEAATSQLPLSVSSPSSDSLQSLHEYLEEDAETCQQCLSGNWTVGGANFTFGKPLASSYVKDAFSVFAASATTAPSPSLQESGEAERGPEDNVRFVFVREGEEYTEADSLLPNSSRGSPPYLSCGNQEAKKEGGPGGQSSSAEDDQLVSASSGAVAAAQSEDPAEVPDPLPLSLLLLREKARAMMYESLSDFRSDLATLWQNSHRIYGEKSRSPHTLAAWFLVKWGLEMLEASLLSEETQREASKAENENQTGQSAEGREGNMKKEEASQAEEEDSEAEEEEEDSDEEEGDEKEEEEPDLPDLEDAEEEENDYDDHDGYSEVEYANSGSEDDGAEYLHGFGNGLPELHAFHHLSHHYFDPGFDPYNDSDTEEDASQEESAEDSDGSVWRLCNLLLHEFVLFLPPWWPIKEVLLSRLPASRDPAPHTWPFEAIRTYVHYCRQGVPVPPNDMLPSWPTPFTPILSVNAPSDSTEPVVGLPTPPPTFLDRLCCRKKAKEWLAGFPEESVCMPTTSAFLCGGSDPIRPEKHLSTFYRPAIAMIELVPLTFEEKKFKSEHRAEMTFAAFEAAGGLPWILQPDRPPMNLEPQPLAGSDSASESESEGDTETASVRADIQVESEAISKSVETGPSAS
uniref:Uncharacterized protein n=1 Tax=Chromera velia CCMP2878 TaxID=1169474 RepID=A0A0G4HZE7_9ALVE|eukprot:Cvel_9700.t1-p1 / transcript=Cvel_9700.t1 / gene=Cvel_9700 / organism=Chromera_velia_CCMP2878 / gene_product=hypothetical protein / transcript_product=hypothetical protein / location=Cvel_scaffold565:57129-67421(-) / protein_length=1066 / sequence_SO=supercontig / SO=protein_coding / is_pseudo=false